MDIDYSKVTIESIGKTADYIIEQIQTFNDNLLKLDDLTWDTYIQPDIDQDHSLSKIMCIFEMSSFHTDKDVRQKCSDAETQLSKYFIDQSMRKDLFNQFKRYYENVYPTEKDNFSDERRRYIEEKMIDYKLSGVDLSDEAYEEVKKIKMEISELCNKFDLNTNNENTSFVFTANDLVGLPENYLTKRLTTTTNDTDDVATYKVSLKYPDYIPIMEHCKNRETRKKMAHAFGNRCVKDNIPICIKVFQLRKQLARIFGYEQYSDYALKKRMAKSTKTVIDFLTNLKERMVQLSQNDVKLLENIAKEDNIDNIHTYDVAYYSRIYTERNSQLDEEELRKHFPLDVVTNGMFHIYETLLGYKFEEVSEQHRHKFWHEEVKLYQVIDIKTGFIKGHFYLDLFPREGKYGHAAVFPFVSQSSGNLPLACMACNFGKGDNLTFSEVETYFHEFGHVMHGISSNVEIGHFSGTKCERDFVETPSQMLEEWCYRPVALKLMSVDLDDETIEKINKKRNMLQGCYYARQLSFGLYDMYLHSSNLDSILSESNTLEQNAENLAKLYEKIYCETVGINVTEGTNMVASFGHIMHGYAAGYYGYLWSLVYAKDMFRTKFINHELDLAVGELYKKEILSYGGSRPSIESLKKFLGREPSSDAFFESF